MSKNRPCAQSNKKESSWLSSNYKAINALSIAAQFSPSIALLKYMKQ